MQLAPGVRALPLDYRRDDRAFALHPAVVETNRGLALLDVGLRGSVGQLRDRLGADDRSLSDVWLVLLTHQDTDHVGALSELLDETGAVVAVHEGDAPAVDGREEPIKTRGGRYPPVSVDVELVDGVSFATRAGPMRVVHTPGHTPGHVSLYFPEERLLVAGDAMVVDDSHGGRRLVGPRPQFTPDKEEAARSVGRLAELDVETVLCYHGGAVEVDPGEIGRVYESPSD
jgi:glyoxylase-like metal-dependent hydrolase (beta-lactamase superfamily II)